MTTRTARSAAEPIALDAVEAVDAVEAPEVVETPILETAPDVTDANGEAADGSERRSPARHLMWFGEALVAGAVAGFVALVLLPVALGWRPYTVLTGSMRPLIQPGDVVMDKPIKVTDVHVGDVVTFSDPTRQGKLVTHRVRSITRGPDTTAVETRGDANTTSERWTIKTRERLGKVQYVIPKVGYVANTIRSPLGLLAILVLPVLGIGAITIRKIWTEDEGDEDEPGQDQ